MWKEMIFVLSLIAITTIGIVLMNVIGFFILGSVNIKNQIDVVSHMGYQVQVSYQVPKGQTVTFVDFPMFLQFLDEYKPSIVYSIDNYIGWFIVPYPIQQAKVYFVHNGIIYLFP